MLSPKCPICLDSRRRCAAPYDPLDFGRLEAILKILVPVKRVADPANANKVKISDGAIDEAGLESKMNPFDEWSLEAALRLTENADDKSRQGEIVLISIGPAEAMQTIRQGLAMGAERGILVSGSDDKLDSAAVANVLKAIYEKEKPDIVFLGKQSADGDSNVAGTLLASMLNLPLVNYVSAIKVDGDALKVKRELDTGLQTIKVKTPCVLTSSDRILAPDSVKNGITSDDFRYPEADGGRYTSLKGIMQAKKKPVEEIAIADLGVEASTKIEYTAFSLPPAKSGQAVFVESATELVEKLKTEAKVL